MHTATALQPIPAQSLVDINQAIEAGQIRDGLGRVVDTTFEDGLINEDATVFYPFVNGVLQMLRDEAIQLPERFRNNNHE